ncbi:MAG TPA: O-antigen ligase family protein, partial [Actinomycetota bacterium]|nr:O-antigen ligase family protein [Actinomycetota bacterium]
MASQRVDPPPTLRPAHVLICGFVGLLPVLHSMFVDRYFMVPQQALLVLALGILVAAAMTGSISWMKRESFWIKASLSMFSLMVVLLGISSILGTDPRRSLVSDDHQGTSWIFWVLCLLLFGATLYLRAEIRDRVSKAVSISAGVLVGLTALWVIGGDAIQEALVPVSREGIPLPGIGNSAYLGAFFGAAALISAGRWIRSPRPRYRLLILAAASVGLMVLTQSRVSMIAFAVCFVVGAWASRHSEGKRIISITGALVVTGFIFQLFLVPNLSPPGSRGQNQDPEQGSAPSKFDPALISGGFDVRRGLWGAALVTIANEPGLGVGANNFSYAYRKYATESNIRLAAQEPIDEVNDAHNIALEVAATGGIPAAIALMAMFGCVAWASKKSLLTGGVKTWAALGALVLFAESMFQALNLVSIPLMLVLSGLAIPDRGGNDETGPSASKALRIVAAVPILAGLLVAGMLVYSDQKLRTASLEWDASVAASAVDGNPFCTVCLFELGKIRRWDYVKEGKGTAEWALEPNLRAIERHPLDSDTYVELGGGLLFMKEPARAIGQFEKALVLDPHSWLAGQGTAVALLRLERFSEAV